MVSEHATSGHPSEQNTRQKHIRTPRYYDDDAKRGRRVAPAETARRAGAASQTGSGHAAGAGAAVELLGFRP